MQNILSIKPHHFVDIITAFGDGKTVFEPHPYGHAVHTAAKRILECKEITLQIELGADAICLPCKHNINGKCVDTIDTSYRPEAPSSKREWNLLIDRRWCQKLDLHEGAQMTAREFCQRIQQKAGDITDIYREIPADRTAERARKLNAGLMLYLEGES